MDLNNSKKKGENLKVTGVSRSGRVRKKSSKLMDFESPDEVVNKYRRIQTSGDSDTDGDGYGEDEDESDDDGEDDDDDEDYEDQLVIVEKTSTQSLYVMEKRKRRKTLKDGQLCVTPMMQRKDKGKKRHTAYLLWGKEVRQELSKQFPDMDFTMMARRLGELWATVPYSEKQHWKRKAKLEGLKKTKNKKEAPLMPSRTFTNKKGGPIVPLHNSPAVQTVQPPVAELSPVESPVREPVEASSPVTTIVSAIAPVDVAAHLKVLGESLSIIGTRLKEHEGQIAISGSLSVLLDSLLCAVGPLLCLTQQVDEMQINQEILSKLLKNVAYMMPGLG